MPGIKDALALTRDYPRLGVGVHLVFSAYRPVLPPSQVPSLVDSQGRFHSQQSILLRLPLIKISELQTELCAQIERFRTLHGSPDHLDVHHFVHVYPPFFEVYVDLAAKYGVPVRLPALPTKDASNLSSAPVPMFLVRAILNRNAQAVARRGVRHPDHFVGSFFGQGNTRESLLSIINALPDGTTELMTHPGLVDPQLLAESTYAAKREEELALLCDPEVRARIDALGIELVTFGALR
jgi:predicted glycoside hydrolase/deacetylase ChbG (UPF0249 family)